MAEPATAPTAPRQDPILGAARGLLPRGALARRLHPCWITLALLGLAACGRTSVSVVLPGEPGAESALLVIGEPESVKVVALDLSAAAPVHLEVDDHGEPLAALLYHVTLASLAIAPGEQTLALSPEAARRLPATAVRFGSRVDPDGVDPWLPLDAAPATLHAVLLQAPSGPDCAASGGCLVQSPEDPADEPFCFTPCPEPPVPEAPRAPALPVPPALPVLRPCPSAWTETSARGFEGCDPPAPTTVVGCSPGEVRRGGPCLPLAPCPSGAWPADLPPGTPVHVQAGALGGDGSEGAPFGLIQEAIAQGARLIALGAGTYREAVALPAGVAIYGRCPTAVVIEAPAPNTTAITARGMQASLHSLSVRGGLGSALVATASSSLELDRTWVEGGREHLLRLDRAAVKVVDSVLHGGDLGVGANVPAGSHLELERVAIVDALAPAIAVSGGATLAARDLEINAPRSGGGASRTALFAADARLDLARIVLRGAAGVALDLVGPSATATITDLAVLDTAVFLDGREGFGLHITGRSQAQLSRVQVARTAGDAVFVHENSAKVAIRDLVVDEAVGVGEMRGGIGMVLPDARVELRRSLFSHCEEGAVSAYDGTEVDMEDLTVREGGPALVLHAARGRVARLESVAATLAVYAAAESQLEAEDVTARRTLWFSLGWSAESRCSVARVFSEEGAAAAVFVEPPSRLDGSPTSTITDVTVRAHTRTGTAGGSIVVYSDARLERVVIDQSDGGVEVARRARAQILDLHLNGATFRGVVARELARLELERIQIEHVRCVGLGVFDEGILSGRDLHVDDTQLWSHPSCVLGGTDLWLQTRGQGQLSHFRISGGALRGVVVADQAQLRLSDGEVSGQPDGALIAGGGQAVDALLLRVRYRDHRRAIVLER